MLIIGERVWTFHSTKMAVVGPLTVREINQETGMCMASNDDDVIRLIHSEFKYDRNSAAISGKSFYEREIRGAELHLATKKERLKKFTKKEGLK